MRPSKSLLLPLLALMLLPWTLGCSETPPDPFREFPDIPAYPGSTLDTREPADTSQPAANCFYRLDDMDWVAVRKFYLKWMPEFGWSDAPSAAGEGRDPNLYYSKGSDTVAINPRTFSSEGRYSVTRFQRDAPGAP